MFSKLNFTLKNENIKSPIDEQILNVVGAYLIITFFFCVVLNSLLLLVFIKYKKLRTPLNELIVVLTFVNLLGSIQFPLVIQSNLYHR